MVVFVVLINGEDFNMLMDSVMLGNCFVVMKVVKWLVEMGYQKILYVMWKGCKMVFWCLVGFVGGCDEMGLFEVSCEVLVVDGYEFYYGEVVVCDWLEQYFDLDGFIVIFCVVDNFVFGVIKVFYVYGLYVFDDILVMGFDGVVLGGFYVFLLMIIFVLFDQFGVEVLCLLEQCKIMQWDQCVVYWLELGCVIVEWKSVLCFKKC